MTKIKIQIVSLFTAAVCLVGGLVKAENKEEKTLSPSRFTVVIDAGHGGIDKGATGVSGSYERDLNLQISKYLKEEFEKANIKVVMTRTGDGGLYGTTERGFKKRDMKKRREIIEKSAPDLVLSIHCDYAKGVSRRGLSVHYAKDNGNSERLSKSLEKTLLKIDGVTRCDVLTADFYITNIENYPSALIECGFLSSKEEEARLNDASYQKNLARFIFLGAYLFLYGVD